MHLACLAGANTLSGPTYNIVDIDSVQEPPVKVAVAIRELKAGEAERQRWASGAAHVVLRQATERVDC